VAIPDELERARRLADAADEDAAKELLLSLMPQIEQADRDDLLLEVFAQLGEIYLVRGANDGVLECIQRIRDCLAIYSAFLAGTMPEAASQVRMSDTEVAQMISRYSRRAQFLQTGLAAAQGDHEGAETALAGLAGAAEDFPDLADEHANLLSYARILCATALCDDDLHVRSLPLWERALGFLDDPSCSTTSGSPGPRHTADSVSRPGGWRKPNLAAARGSSGAGERVGTCFRQNTIGARRGGLVSGRPRDD